jgi:hypothetical protein
MAFSRLRCLPSTVRGPVDFFPFCRFASSFFTESNLRGVGNDSGVGVSALA